MKLEQQVCSLDLAKRLKELGIKQDSLFMWRKNFKGFWWVWYDGDFESCNNVSAFTSAELGKMLPDDTWSARVLGRQVVNYQIDDEDYPIGQEAPTEADARSKMLIYLIEKGIVNL